MDCLLDGGLRPELLEDRGRAAHCGRIITFGKGARFLVRAAELVPGGGSPGPVTGDEESVRLGQTVGRDIAVAGLPQRPGDFTPQPATAMSEDQIAHRERFCACARLIAIQESRLGARGADRSQAR